MNDILNNCLFMGAGFVLALIIVLLYFKINVRTGGITMIKNPNNDPDNPYVLQFSVNPETWLKGKYVMLKVRKKN